MNNRQRFEALMAGEAPDRVPLLIFSELLPGDLYETLIRPAGGGLIVHTGSVYSRRNQVTEINEEQGSTRLQRLSTSRGELCATFRTGQEAISGSGEVQTSYFVKGEADYPAMIEALEDITFHLDDSHYRQVIADLGDQGVPHTWCDEPPYMGLQYLLGLENWALEQYDHPRLFASLMEAYGRLQRRRMLLQAEAPEKILINLGNLAGNYSPAAFESEVMPYFREYGQLLREAGCTTTVHADALNLAAHRGIRLQDCVDVIEAFTPPPVGDLTLAQAREAWGPQVVFHINIPEALFWSGPEACFDWTRELIRSDPNPRKFLSFTEMGFLGVSAEQWPVFWQGMQGVLDALERHGRY